MVSQHVDEHLQSFHNELMDEKGAQAANDPAPEVQQKPAHINVAMPIIGIGLLFVGIIAASIIAENQVPAVKAPEESTFEENEYVEDDFSAVPIEITPEITQYVPEDVRRPAAKKIQPPDGECIAYNAIPTEELYGTYTILKPETLNTVSNKFYYSQEYGKELQDINNLGPSDIDPNAPIPSGFVLYIANKNGLNQRIQAKQGDTLQALHKTNVPDLSLEEFIFLNTPSIAALPIRPQTKLVIPPDYILTAKKPVKVTAGKIIEIQNQYIDVDTGVTANTITSRFYMPSGLRNPRTTSSFEAKVSQCVAIIWNDTQTIVHVLDQRDLDTRN